jgi:palmitoyltransferase ZDHHC13/17
MVLNINIDLDFWQAAQRGAFGRVTYLVESGQHQVTDKDSGKVTALHWAAINNHIAIAKYLLDKGAEIDAKGGTFV